MTTFSVTADALSPVGDGITLAKVPLQAQLDAGVVTIPAGVYRAWDLVVTRPNTVIRGAGRGRTILLNNANGEGMSALGAHLSGLQIQDLTMAANKGSRSQRLLNADGVDDLLIANCSFSGAGNNAVNVYNSRNPRLVDCDFSDCGNYGALFYGCESPMASGTRFHDFTAAFDFGHAGMEFKNCRRGKVTGCAFDSIAGYGLEIYSDGVAPDEYHTVTGNTFNNITTGLAAALAVYARDSNHHTITSNPITGAGSGISLQSSVGTTVMANPISGCGGTAIGLGVDTSDCYVAGNPIHSSAKRITNLAGSANHVEDYGA